MEKSEASKLQYCIGELFIVNKQCPGMLAERLWGKKGTVYLPTVINASEVKELVGC
jgi:hypothetical protein